MRDVNRWVQPSRPQCVGPSPQVWKAIRRDMKLRRLSPRDRRMPSVAASLVAEPSRWLGLNEGVFYPESALPRLTTRARALAPARAVRSRPTTGTVRVLVLLVDFPDLTGERPATQFEDILFSKGTYATGSMRDFYRENSYRKLDVQGDVVGWLRLPKPYSFYVGADNGCDGAGYPRNSKGMVEDALTEAARTVDFSKFDANGDEHLDGLFVIHAGSGAEADPDPTSRKSKMWSHQWNISKPFVSNGVTAYAYVIVPEDCRVGVCSHEFGHMLGLPDLYDTTYESEGVGAWCVMGGGSWNGGGDTPGHLCGWSKARLAWLKPRNVKRPRSLKLDSVEEHRVVYRLWTKGQLGDEYFLIENRQLIGFDRKLPAAGLLVYRINDGAHNNDHSGDYWVGVQQADGDRDLELGRNGGDQGDPYPGSSNNVTFDGTSNPSSVDRLGRATGVSIRAIAIENGRLSCKVKL